MSMPLCYIAGPFRGATPLDVRRNVEAARDVGLLVAQAGAYPVIPHTMTSEFDKQLTDEFWLQGTMELLRRCDGILLMSTWQRSRGAQEERAEAQRLELPIFYESDGYGFVAGWAYAWKENRYRAKWERFAESL